MSPTSRVPGTGSPRRSGNTRYQRLAKSGLAVLCAAGFGLGFGMAAANRPDALSPTSVNAEQPVTVDHGLLRDVLPRLADSRLAQDFPQQVATVTPEPSEPPVPTVTPEGTGDPPIPTVTPEGTEAPLPTVTSEGAEIGTPTAQTPTPSHTPFPTVSLTPGAQTPTPTPSPDPRYPFHVYTPWVARNADS